MIELSSSKKFSGSIVIPSDKSISHRSAILNAVSFGEANIENYSNGDDCVSTINVLKSLGVNINVVDNKDSLNLKIIAKGYQGLSKPSSVLDAGNSGTTTRLVSGVLATLNFESELSGDSSLTSRPMKRIIDPLSQMGAKFYLVIIRLL